MISRFNRYIILLFIKITILVQVMVGVVSLLANTAMHTKMMEKYNATFMDIFIYDLMKLPYLLYSTMPMSIVFSTLMVMITLIKNNELIAYVSLGGRIRNLAQPFIIGGLAVSLLLLLMANSLNPKIMYMREKFASGAIFKKEMDIRPTLSNIWLKLHGNRFIHITAVDPDKMEFHYVTEYILNDDLQVQSIESYNSAKREGKKWRLFNQKKYDMKPIPRKTFDHRNALEDKPIFDELSSMPFLKPQYVSISDIYKVADVMKNQNMNISKYQMQIYKIYAHAVSVLVIIMLVFPMCVTFSRNHSYIRIAVTVLSSGFGYLIFSASCVSLGKNGILNPFFANFLPVIIFSAFAAYLIYKREHAL